MNTQLAELAKNFDVSLRGALSALATLLICLLAVRIVTKAARRLLSRSKLDVRMQKYLLSAIKAVLYLITAIIVIGSLGIDMTSLVALLSVASL